MWALPSPVASLEKRRFHLLTVYIVQRNVTGGYTRIFDKLLDREYSNIELLDSAALFTAAPISLFYGVSTKPLRISGHANVQCLKHTTHPVVTGFTPQILMTFFSRRHLRMTVFAHYLTPLAPVLYVAACTSPTFPSFFPFPLGWL